MCGLLKILAYPSYKWACKVLRLSAVAKAADRLFPGCQVFYVDYVDAPVKQKSQSRFNLTGE